MPKKYRKKPFIIEAFRFGIDGWPDWFHDKHITNDIITYSNDPNEGPFSKSSNVHCEIETLKGTMRGDYGDFIIKGIQGEVYPCKPDIFEASYEEYKGVPMKVSIVDTDLFKSILEKSSGLIDQIQKSGFTDEYGHELITNQAYQDFLNSFVAKEKSL